MQEPARTVTGWYFSTRILPDHLRVELSRSIGCTINCRENTRFLGDPSKAKVEANDESSLTRKFIVQVEWVEPVVSIHEIQHAECQLGLAPSEAISGKGIKLPKVIARNTWVISLIALAVPQGVELCKEPRTMIVDRIQVHVVQRGRQMLCRPKR